MASGQTIVSLPGVPTSGGSPYGFFLVDLDSSVAGVDTLYVADDAANVIQKYSLVAGVWSSNGTIAASGVRGLTGRTVGTSVNLYSATAGSLYAFTDTTGYNGAVSGTVASIASAGSNTAFRGVAFTPGTPLAVTLADFHAQQVNDHVLVSWETVSELDNAGFNLYRADSAGGPQTLLAYVSSQAPGASQGASYSYEDLAVQSGESWWYWLEDVSLSGATTLHGPVSATVSAPTAVRVAGLDAGAGPAPVLPWASAAGLGALAALAVVWRRQRGLAR